MKIKVSKTTYEDVDIVFPLYYKYKVHCEFADSHKWYFGKFEEGYHISFFYQGNNMSTNLEYDYDDIPIHMYENQISKESFEINLKSFKEAISIL